MKSFCKFGAVAAFFAVGFAAFNASAQECYRSTECEGDLICVDLACVASEEPQTVCSDTEPCSFGEICNQGVCKPDGVACTNDYGICVAGSPHSYCRCDGGLNMGSDEGCDGTDCDTEPPADEELYARCTDSMIATCEAPPDVNEVCSDEQIAICTEVLVLWNALEGNCEEDDPDSVESSDSEGEVDMETDGSSGEDTAASTEDGASDPGAGGAENYVPDAWEIAECCEELAELEEYPEDKAYFDCIAALEPDDCEGYQACEEMVDDDINVGKDDDTDASGDVDIDTDADPVDEGTDVSSEEDTEADIDEDNEDTETSDDGDDNGNSDSDEADNTEDTESVQDTETATSSADKSDGGGCSFVHTNRPSDVFSLAAALL